MKLKKKCDALYVEKVVVVVGFFWSLKAQFSLTQLIAPVIVLFARCENFPLTYF